ncbi:hypothetical protein CEXT_299941 [Caerostris extrusa]|uniref:Uncharacterized protein n=1 Tax=Caerostris extrusa TaxID=172846 RepID=A0AAV4X269_CAEEX|nr:hypothetical protein CEXT_299941 [Caerostris extrusa]
MPQGEKEFVTDHRDLYYCVYVLWNVSSYPRGLEEQMMIEEGWVWKVFMPICLEGDLWVTKNCSDENAKHGWKQLIFPCMYCYLHVMCVSAPEVKSASCSLCRPEVTLAVPILLGYMHFTSIGVNIILL